MYANFLKYLVLEINGLGTKEHLLRLSSFSQIQEAPKTSLNKENIVLMVFNYCLTKAEHQQWIHYTKAIYRGVVI